MICSNLAEVPEIRRSTDHIQNIDLLRGVAILLVFAFHTQEHLVKSYRIPVPDGFGLDGATTWSELLLNLSPAAFGWSGVDLFLLISGFLIHYGHLVKGRSRWLDFAGKRFWRIYPPYLLVLVAFGLLLGPFSGSQWLSHLTLSHNLFESSFFGINPSFWSLALEAQLYALYPLLLLVRKRFGIARTVWLLWLISLPFVIHNAVELPTGSVLKLSVFRMWVLWGLGAWIAERYFQGRSLFRSHLRWLFFLSVCILVVYMSFLRPWLLRYSIMLFHAVLLDFVASNATIGVGEDSAGRRSSVLRFLQALGLCSYSFYLVHQPMLAWIHRRLPFVEGAGIVLEILLSFTLILGLSYAMYRFVELPSIRLGRFLKHSKAR